LIDELKIEDNDLKAIAWVNPKNFLGFYRSTRDERLAS
jgi:hypothetical protein